MYRNDLHVSPQRRAYLVWQRRKLQQEAGTMDFSVAPQHVGNTYSEPPMPIAHPIGLPRVPQHNHNPQPDCSVVHGNPAIVAFQNEMAASGMSVIDFVAFRLFQPLVSSQISPPHTPPVGPTQMQDHANCMSRETYAGHRHSRQYDSSAANGGGNNYGSVTYSIPPALSHLQGGMQ